MSTIAHSLMRIHDETHTLPPGSPNLHTATASHRLDIEVADSFAGRLRGLMLRRLPGPNAALLLMQCSSVHTAFMLMPIDVVYLDPAGVVTKCVPHLRPFRASVGGGRATAHTLELPAGAIERLGIAEGDRVEHPLLQPKPPRGRNAPVARGAAIGARRHRRGVAIAEMLVVGPLLTILGLSGIQYGLMFQAKNQINQAAFMAARAGSVGNAKMDNITEAYAKALVPMYGGGSNAAEIATALVKAKADVGANAKIILMNPTKESFDDWHDDALAAKLHTNGKRVIPNSRQASKDHNIKPSSGQTIQDANLIKLRIIHGYAPPVPIVASIYKAYLQWSDDKSDPFKTRLIQSGLVPMQTDVTAQMQSDAIEENPMSAPGQGNNGNPTPPSTPPQNPPGNPPDCDLGGCTTTPSDPGDSGPGGYCPVPMQTTLSADTTFAFGSSTLTADGKAALDQLVQQAQASGKQFSTIDVTGYTDPLGSASLNDSLSKARAKAVSDYLASKGLTADTVNVVGAGSNNLIKTLTDCPGNGDAAQKACLQPDRRVEIVLTPK